MVNNIFFYTETEVIHPFPTQEDCFKNWLANVAISEEKHIVSLNYIFCTDDYLLDINNKYLGHDFYTDIITFPYQQGEAIESDLFISLDRIRENADIYKVSFDNELKRVMVHGLLHLVGYGDKSEIEIMLIRQKEDHYIETWKNFG